MTVRWVVLALALAPAAAWAQADGGLTPPPPPPAFETGAPPVAEAPATPDAGTTRVPAVPAAPEVAAEPAPERRVTVTFKDGQRLTGTLVRSTPYLVELKLGSGQTLQIDTDAVAHLEDDVVHHVSSSGKIWFDDPNRTRYFYSPSAMMMKRGEAHFSQKELAISAFSYGLLDYLNVEVASAVPAFFAGLNGVNFLLALKAGAQISEKLYLAVGAQALLLPGVSSGNADGIPVLGLYFGSVTYGDRDFHVTVSGGMPFVLKPPTLGSPLFTLSACWRVAEMVAILSENWFLPTLANLGQSGGGQFFLAQVAGVRLMGEHFATDLGLIFTETQQGFLQPVNFPIPWIDFTYNF